MKKGAAYKRVLLKLSGEILQGSNEGGIHRQAIQHFCEEIVSISKKGVQFVIVVGGGNFWRYKDQVDLGFDRTVSDNIGMLATIMNAVALHSIFQNMGVKNIPLSSLSVSRVLDDYTPRLALKALECGWIVIAAGGTGNPFFSTDTAAALRALELRCDVLLKGTNVDYIYDKDPKHASNAKKFQTISFQEVLHRGLKAMDHAAIALCEEGGLPVHVFNMLRPGNLKKIIAGEKIGTLIVQ